MLWIPNLIYKNTENSDDTLSAIGKSTLTIERQGRFTRSGLHFLDEIEIFKGVQNPIIMHQTFTKVFMCKYTLKMFPFDTQVLL